MSLSPFLRTPFTDLTGCLINHQQYGKCGQLEMDMVECLEAYGIDRGKKKCADLIADFQECATMKKQIMRIETNQVVDTVAQCRTRISLQMHWARTSGGSRGAEAMRIERLKQYMKGERSKEELYAPPPRVDAY